MLAVERRDEEGKDNAHGSEAEGEDVGNHQVVQIDEGGRDQGAQEHPAADGRRRRKPQPASEKQPGRQPFNQRIAD